MKTCICLIAKDEDNYIKEWSEYHLKLGFDDIFVFQNDWRCKVNDLNKHVHLIEYDGEAKQNQCYNEFIQNIMTYMIFVHL